MAADVDERDQRKDEREPVTLVVEYEGAEDLLGDYTENLSKGGTFVATNRELPIGTEVQLVLSFPGLLEPIAIAGTVRWTRGADAEAGTQAGAGIEFSPGPGQEQLADVIARIRARDPRLVSRVSQLFKILVVEDNKHVAALIHDGLVGSARRDFGEGVAFDIKSAEDGREAVELLRSQTFDAMIIDIYLPVLDGVQVIRTARGELGLGKLPIIAVSAGGDTTRKDALDAGANMFIDKPMRLRQVIETMQKLIGVTTSASP